MTPYSNRCDILSELWMDYRYDEALQRFVEYNDLGLPAAFLISEGIVSTTPKAEEYINETFDMLLASLGLEDTGWDSLEDLLDSGEIEE